MTPEKLKQKVTELIQKGKLEFIGCEPIIADYGVDKTKGEWVKLVGTKKRRYYLNKGKVVSEQL